MSKVCKVVIGRLVVANPHILRAASKGYGISQNDGQKFSMDFIVNIDEIGVREKLEQFENIDGTLDGMLSLKNAVTVIEL